MSMAQMVNYYVTGKENYTTSNVRKELGSGNVSTVKAWRAALNNGTMTASDLADASSDLRSTVSEMGTGFTQEMVADNTAAVSSYLTGEFGGGQTAGASKEYIARTQVYADDLNDYIAAARRLLEYSSELITLVKQRSANNVTQQIIKQSIAENAEARSVSQWNRLVLASKLSSTAAIVHGTVRKICHAVAYQATEMCATQIPDHVSHL